MESPKSFCVHGHFYQPPREDPLTGEIPVEIGAAPYHNWNEKINDQCYQPNAKLGNFEHISFNIGPTLVSWLEEFDPKTLQMIVESDHINMVRYGVGNAMAQSYHHTILPLASRLDKETQIIWGIKDFIRHFSHKPKGMWMPETAVDMETLQVLAENGIEFTIMAPWQAEVEDLDETQPYRIDLENNLSINVFFYQQDLSTHVSFDPGATSNADLFASNYILTTFKKLNNKPVDHSPMLLIASDGEAYGHHHRFREKFLAHLMNGAIENKNLLATFPAKWLLDKQPSKKIKIRENTSWSCHHGVKRWSEVCGCAPSAVWKSELRNVFDQVAEWVDAVFLDELKPITKDPWELRHHMIALDHTEETIFDYVFRLTGTRLKEHDQHKMMLLLAAQFERQRMYTSCAWFFGELDRIEPKNNIAYAAQALFLTEKITGKDYVSQAIKLFEKVKSTRTNLNGGEVFQKHISRCRQSDEAFIFNRKFSLII